MADSRAWPLVTFSFGFIGFGGVARIVLAICRSFVMPFSEEDMMFYEPFEGPFGKIRWARSKLDALEKVLSDYAARVKYGFKEVSEPGADLIELRFSFSEKPPMDIPLLIGDAIHNLRSSLDLMVSDIARMRNVDPAKLAFPLAKDEYSLGKEIRNRKIARLGDDVVSKIRELKPYAPGNRLLSALNEYDIIDKHQMILPVFSAVPFSDIQAGPLSIYGTTAFMPGGSIHIARGTPFRMKNSGVVIAEFPFDSPLFLGGTAVEALNQLAELVQSIVEGFMAHLAANPDKPPAAPIVNDLGA